MSCSLTLTAGGLALLLAVPALAQTAPGRPLAQSRPAASAAASTALASTAPVPNGGAVTAPTQLRGIVRTPDGQPCPGAAVYLAGAARDLVVTDAQGTFSLPVPAGGPVSLRVDYFSLGSSRVELPAVPAEPLAVTLGR